MAAQQRGHTGAVAVKRHGGGGELGHGRNHGADRERQTARTGGALLDLAGVGLHFSQQVFESLPGFVGRGHHQHVAASNDVDGVELAVVQLADAQHGVQLGVFCADQQRVAIRRLLVDEVGGNGAHATRFVLQHNFLAQGFFSVRHEGTGNHVGGTTGAPLDHARELTVRVSLGGTHG